VLVTAGCVLVCVQAKVATRRDRGLVLITLIDQKAHVLRTWRRPLKSTTNCYSASGRIELTTGMLLYMSPSQLFTSVERCHTCHNIADRVAATVTSRILSPMNCG